MFNKILSLFLKANCPFCDRATDQILCQYCEQKLRHCQWKNHLQNCPNDYLLFSWGRYDDYLKRSIAVLKYDKKKEIGELLGNWLGEAWLQSGKKKTYPRLTVIPIPLHPEKLEIRGFNQAELIAKSFCDVTGYELKTNLLIRVKNTEAMFGLSVKERKANIDRAFTIGKDYKKVNPHQLIFLIDDIYTTGATVNEGIKILKEAKLKPLGVATVSSSAQYSNTL